MDMFIPSKFRVTDENEILNFISNNLFGTLVVNDSAGVPNAVHIPFNCQFDSESKSIVFHVDNHNDMIQSIQQSQKGKLIVLGAHGYISSSVYGHINAPTYNYQAVHVSGKITQLSNEELYQHLADLVKVFEKDRENKLTMDYWSKDFMEANLKLITGFKIDLEQVECAFKLSQNRNNEDYQRIVDDLSNRGQDDIKLAEVMKQLNHKKL